VKDRFEFGVGISEEEYQSLGTKRAAMRAELAAILGKDGVLIMPTVPSAAPLRDAAHEDLKEFREKALELLCVSGLTGFPQITLPLAQVHGAPMGISLMGPRGSDQRLIALGARIMGD
jgi:amidase